MSTSSSTMAPPSPATLISKIFNTKIAPLSLAGSWDNVGLLVEAPFPRPGANKVLLTIDLSSAVCKEAEAISGLGAIVSYHPPIFSGLKSLTLSNPLQTSLLRLSAQGISVFAPHTSLDAVPGGMTDWLALPFKPFTSSQACQPEENPPVGFEGAGSGRVVELEGEGLEIEEVVKRVKRHVGMEMVQLARGLGEPKKVRSIAVCPGSGGSVLGKVKADLYLTGEMSHHEILATIAKGTTVILCGHTNTERGFLSHTLKAQLESELAASEDASGPWEVIVSKEDREPWVFA